LASGKSDNTRKWSFKKEKTLCSLWQQEPHLYDRDDPDYRNKEKRTEAIDYIATAVGMDGVLKP
jgi:hypothetical protein